MNIIQTIDFGSTFTKVSAIDIDTLEIVGTSKSFTTIETDVREGYEKAVKELSAQTGKIEFAKKIASSSAAGGLKMIASGLVPELTAKASKMAASSAGAKVLKTYSYELSKDELGEIYGLKPDIMLLCGGIDGGNKDVILANAKAIAGIDQIFHVIVAGNKTVAREACEIIQKSGKTAIVTENVMPEFNKLNIAPAKEEIRNLFIKNIIEAKGLNLIQRILDDDIIPTPLAVFEAAELLSRGTENEKGLGSIMAYDVGGATTDVYSMASGDPTKPNVMLKSFRESYAKRTVEGDIGVRYSISSLVEEAGAESIGKRLAIAPELVTDWVNVCKAAPEILAEKHSLQSLIDEELAASAVAISAERHCGYIEVMFTPFGESYLQTGKDLTTVEYIIGAGGSVINSHDPAKILSRALFDPVNVNMLKPIKPKLLLDKTNLFAAMGLLGRLYPDAAIKIMKEKFIQL